jgi:hypothetical protein
MLLALAVFSVSFAAFSPGQPTMILAHNTYPDQNRIDRALATGTPLAMEIDLSWVPNPKTGKNGSIVGDVSPARIKDLTGNEPALKQFFFEHMRPFVEKALKENNKKSWPLVRLYLDIKNDPAEHLEFLWSLLGEYENWLTTAVKTKNAADQSPLDLKPLLVMLEDKDNDIKEEYFYNKVTVGGKLRAFGTAKVAMLPPGTATTGLNAKQILYMRYKMKPEELVTEHASNYRRWWGMPWDAVEQGAKSAAGAWTPEKEARLNALVKYAHKMGYLTSFWVLDGCDPEVAKRNGWGQNYNFGSLEAGTIRWKAAIKAGADFISTDQYEEVAKLTKSSIN